MVLWQVYSQIILKLTETLPLYPPFNMIFIFLFFLYPFNQAVSSQPPIYHNHAVWWVGNFTAAPTNPVPDPVNNGLATIANRCDHPVYVW